MGHQQAATSPAVATPEGGEDFQAFYSRTSGSAYGLALRITGQPGPAAAACEAAYVRAWNERDMGARLELRLLERVRAEALGLTTSGPPPGPARSDAAEPSYTETAVMRAALAQVEPAGRRAIELAFFGGVGVADIVEIIGDPATVVRAAMRAALLRIGELTRPGQETTT